MTAQAHATAAAAAAVATRIDPAKTPIRVIELELGRLAQAPETAPALQRADSVLALVRLHRQPIGVVHATIADDADPCATLAKLAQEQLAPEIAAHMSDDGDTSDTGDAPGLGKHACGRLRARMLAEAPSMSVIVATRERPDSLARCLDSLLALEYSQHAGIEIIVVDNAPATSTTARLVHARYADRVAYTVEPRRGLANAHNRGLAEASGELLAFTDDDVIVDRDWAAALAEAFVSVPRAGCVTGLIMPAELETRPQAMLERRGAFAKGFRLTEHLEGAPGTHPLFPFTAGRLGSGANMAFRAAALRAMGGFDPALGTGTPARGGDDLLAFFRTAVSGHSVVYQPAALVWHHHRRDSEALSRQAFGYGVGLGAYLTATIAREPMTAFSLLRKLPAGAAYALRTSRPDDFDSGAWPARLSRLERCGLICGPFAYARSRWKGAARG